MPSGSLLLVAALSALGVGGTHYIGNVLGYSINVGIFHEQIMLETKFKKQRLPQSILYIAICIMMLYVC